MARPCTELRVPESLQVQSVTEFRVPQEAMDPEHVFRELEDGGYTQKPVSEHIPDDLLEWDRSVLSHASTRY